MLGTANVDEALRKDVCVLCMHLYMYAFIYVCMYVGCGHVILQRKVMGARSCECR